MTSEFDRDNSVDRLLKGAGRGLTSMTPGEAGPACLDAETLAAWADGGLDADRVRKIEAHVSDCARCQALSAAFFSSDEGIPAPASKVAPFRTNRVMYWLPIAAGTIAAMLVIWMGIHGRNLPDPTSQMSDALVKETAPPAASGGSAPAGTQARQEAPPAITPMTAPARAQAKQAESKSQQRLDARQSDLRAERGTQNSAASRSRATTKPQGQAGAPATPIPGTVAPPLPKPVPVAQPQTRAMPPPPASPVTTATPTPTPTPTPVQTQTAVTSAAGRSAAGVVGESVFRAAAAPQVVAEFTSLDPRASTMAGLPGVAGGVAARGGGAGAGGRGGGGGGGRGGAVADVAPSPLVQWRILSSDVLEKSTDRVTWEPIAIAPPVQGLLQGSAPSPTVCWIVGRAGLVLLTTDGRQFTRVTAPATADLVSIRALDARQATVTTIDGQTFTTSDGGKNWR